MVAASNKQVGRVETVMDEKDAVKNPKPEAKWSERVSALRRVPPVMKMVWSCAPEVVVESIAARLIVSVVPVALLVVTRQVIDTIDRHLWYHWALPHYFWWLVALEFVLASIAAMLGRLLNYFDTILADKFTRHISTRIMEHASRLDLTRYEDPLFYDKMERARVQGTD
ncbi:MAG TPA: hypothetical protein VN885_10770, partial [Candidatus Acidoferrales bacterium]|nr:hypothetical protein [Candidatus Acidoferrales bacterium]